MRLGMSMYTLSEKHQGQANTKLVYLPATYACQITQTRRQYMNLQHVTQTRRQHMNLQHVSQYEN